MGDIEKLQEVPLIIWILLAVVLLIQGSWIFYDASKRGENKWLWGLFGILNTPSNLIVYLIVTRIIFKTKECYKCGKNVKENALYCPYCGNKFEDDDRI
ncbi:zinc ribbon domain-containing protein [Sporosalibacterium faouarense]|uniref:zinc ribbon domain-containing protein n=1 Tax=Sporosalibacterium faouarense TaxID=516123 RepID=UPI00141C1871|nr:zinc ribbon domain-containing protein [Sporosalibacterium faouarense]MTI47498.1 zinc ribbon domain-containing protein [Bacillota bacterium]